VHFLGDAFTVAGGLGEQVEYLAGSGQFKLGDKFGFQFLSA